MSPKKPNRVRICSLLTVEDRLVTWTTAVPGIPLIVQTARWVDNLYVRYLRNIYFRHRAHFRAGRRKFNMGLSILPPAGSSHHWLYINIFGPKHIFPWWPHGKRPKCMNFSWKVPTMLLHIFNPLQSNLMTESGHLVTTQGDYSLEMPPSYFTREIHYGVNTIDLVDA